MGWMLRTQVRGQACFLYSSQGGSCEMRAKILGPSTHLEASCAWWAARSERSRARDSPGRRYVYVSAPACENWASSMRCMSWT